MRAARPCSGRVGGIDCDDKVIAGLCWTGGNCGGGGELLPKSVSIRWLKFRRPPCLLVGVLLGDGRLEMAPERGSISSDLRFTGRLEMAPERVSISSNLRFTGERKRR